MSTGQRMEQRCQVHVEMCWALCVQPATTAPACHSARSMVLCTYLHLAADCYERALVAVKRKGLSLRQELLQVLWASHAMHAHGHTLHTWCEAQQRCAPLDAGRGVHDGQRAAHVADLGGQGAAVVGARSLRQPDGPPEVGHQVVQVPANRGQLAPLQCHAPSWVQRANEQAIVNVKVPGHMHTPARTLPCSDQVSSADSS